MRFNKLPDLIGRHQRFKRVFESDYGRIVLRDIMKEARLDASSYVEGDPHKTSFNEGAEWLARRILEILRRDPVEEIDALEQEKRSYV